MKLHRPAAVLVSAVILTGGAVVAVNAATATDPVTLCSSNKSGAVTVPVTGSCAKGTTEFSVANNADVKALADRIDVVAPAVEGLDGRLDTAESALTSQGNQIASLAARPLTLSPKWYESRSTTVQIAPGAGDTARVVCPEGRYLAGNRYAAGFPLAVTGVWTRDGNGDGYIDAYEVQAYHPAGSSTEPRELLITIYCAYIYE